MGTIERTSQFNRDYKRETKGRHRAILANDLVEILTMLANDQPLAERFRDHSLTGEWKDCRDCHIKPDQAKLQLVRLASHSKLGL